MISAQQALSFIFVGAIWGCTNPLLKRGGAGIENVKSSGGPLSQSIAELWYLVTRWQWLIPFALNQSGSLVYYLTLGSADISMAVPLANSLTFMWTWVVDYILGEERGSWHSAMGTALVVVGVALCVYSKLETGTPP